MPVGKARKDPIRTATRTTKRLALVAALAVTGSTGLQPASANGDTRTITLHHTHRGDDITVTFKRNGRYDDEGLKKLNHFLRDWRTDDATTMDPQLFDAVWEVQRETGDKPIHIISSYRSPRTNEMLRKRSSGVARHSLHMQGKAMDFFIPGVPLERVREAGLRLQRGGVGFYPTSGSPFVHIDVGSVRHWPRMTREQLAKVFPDGRTVHLPTDGKPLAGFALAQADIERRASSPSAFEAARVAANDRKSTNPLAKLFGFKPKPDEEDDSEAATAAPAAPKVANAAPRGRDNVFAGVIQTKPEVKLEPVPATAPAAAPEPKPVPVADIPVPRSRPMPPSSPASNQVALNQPAPVAAAPAVPFPQGLGTFTLAGMTDIFSARGYWQGLPDAQPEARQVASADTATGSIGPFAAPPGFGDGKPREQTLAYASPAVEPDAQRGRTAAAPMPRQAAVSANTTVASKARSNSPTEVISAPAWANLRDWQMARLEGPWVRALILTPSVAHFMNTTLYGIQDYRYLRPLLQAPTEIIVMTFGAEPNRGLSHVRFEGRAIEFPATATFRSRTAALRQ